MTNDITKATPRLSVVIPMYNESRRMKRQLAAVCAIIFGNGRTA